MLCVPALSPHHWGLLSVTLEKKAMPQILQPAASDERSPEGWVAKQPFQDFCVALATRRQCCYIMWSNLIAVQHLGLGYPCTKTLVTQNSWHTAQRGKSPGAKLVLHSHSSLLFLDRVAPQVHPMATSHAVRETLSHFPLILRLHQIQSWVMEH